MHFKGNICTMQVHKSCFQHILKIPVFLLLHLELIDNLNLLLTRHTQKKTIKAFKPRALQAKLNGFNMFSTFLSTNMCKSLVQVRNTSGFSCIWKTAKCLHVCICLHAVTYPGDRHLPHIQDMTPEMGDRWLSVH